VLLATDDRDAGNSSGGSESRCDISRQQYIGMTCSP
jgi:hypothetical protein